MKPNLFVCAVIISSCFTPCAFGQGSLTPTAPPGPTMLTLSQVEPRTPISSTPYAISQSGSYYLTTNLVGVSGQDGIDINANNVTLDLEGFSLTGSSASPYGIAALGSNIRVSNGIVTGWEYAGVSVQGRNVSLDRLTVSGSYNYGIEFYGSPGDSLRNSTVTGNTNTGVYCFDSSVTLEGLIVSSNNSDGIFFQGAQGAEVRDCRVNGNIYFGVNAYGSTNVNLDHDTISGNFGAGVIFNTTAGSTISDCGISGNTNNAIDATCSGCLILGNNCGENAGGIIVAGENNRIEGNQITLSSGYGIEVVAPHTNNIVVKNSVEGGGANDYFLGPSQFAGPLITNAPAGVITNSNPWANFGF